MADPSHGMVEELSERMCIVTRTTAGSERLLRFVCSPDGSVVADIACKLPGRGVWVGLSRELVREAVRRRLFAKGLGEDCAAPANLPDQVAELLERAALGLLSLANKAGLVVQGFEKVSRAIEAGKVAVLIEASDGSLEGRRKLRNRLAATGSEVQTVAAFDSERLGLALGRPHVIHAAVAQNGLAGRFLAAVGRLEAYREHPGRAMVNVGT